MVCAWCVHGVCMACAWRVQWCVHAWRVHGVCGVCVISACMEGAWCVWCMCDKCSMEGAWCVWCVHAWRVHGVCMACARCVCDVCMHGGCMIGAYTNTNISTGSLHPLMQGKNASTLLIH